MKIHLPPPRGGKTNGEHVRMEKKRLHTYVQIQAISMSIKRISLSPQCNEASCQINCLPPSRLTLDFVFWANDRIRATDIMSFIFVVSSKGRQDGELFICFSHFPALLSLSLSLFVNRAVGSWYGYTRQPRPFHPRCLIFPSPSQPFFPFLLLVIFSLLMINPRYKPPVSPVRLSIF